MSAELNSLTIAGALEGLAKKEFSAVELAHADGRAMAALLSELAALARSAQSRGDALYLWTSL